MSELLEFNDLKVPDLGGGCLNGLGDQTGF